MATKQESIEKRKVAGKDCPEFRVSFPHVFKPHAFQEGQEAKFSITMLFDKKTNLDVLKKAAHNAAVEKFGKDYRNVKKFDWPFRDGNEKADLEGYKDKITLTAKSKDKPGLVNQKREPIVDGDGQFYAGCYARASLIAFAYDTMGNKGVGFALQNVQKTRDGDAFSGKKKAEDEFDDVDDGSDNPDNYGEGSDDEGDFDLGD